MPTLLDAATHRNEIQSIVQGVLDTMAKYPVAACEAEGALRPQTITGAVSFAGSWCGAVLVECPIPMALSLTSVFMRMPKGSEVDDLVLDSIGELTNMIGGNLKSVLPSGVALSMPTVVEGSSYRVRVCGAEAVTVPFTGPDGLFWVTLVELEQKILSRLL